MLDCMDCHTGIKDLVHDEQAAAARLHRLP